MDNKLRFIVSTNIIDENIENDNCEQFKIGKTGENLADRFNDDPLYYEVYNEIIEISASQNEKNIDDLEKELITKYLDHPKCNNDQIGGGEMELNSLDNYYRVYLVVKEPGPTD